MEIDEVKLVYYSPTGTTRKVIHGIGEGTGHPVADIDLTLPSAPGRDELEFGDELAIMGAPVYGGRLPETAVDRLSGMRGRNTPAVLAVVYGNREYENALKELEVLVLARGFLPLVAGSFVGEHSFSTDRYPIAPGRPDPGDLATARELGRAAVEKLRPASGPEAISPPDIPGGVPVKDRSGRGILPPLVAETDCVRCDRCLAVCPTGASGTAFAVADTGNCTLCTACVRVCLARARSFSGEMAAKVDRLAAWLSSSYSARREPELFL